MQIKKEAEERDAMTRMSELYTKNPNLGDAAPLVHRLAENQKSLDALQAELAKFQVSWKWNLTRNSCSYVSDYSKKVHERYDEKKKTEKKCFALNWQGFMHEVETQLNQLSGSNQDLSPGGVKENLRHSTSDLSMASDSTGKQ